MQIISNEDIAKALEAQAASQSVATWQEFSEAIAGQSFLLNYVARQEMAADLGEDGQKWATEPEPPAPPNDLMLLTVASLFALVGKFTGTIPTVEPALVRKAEQSLEPLLLKLLLNADATDQDLLNALVDTCRQKHLLDFAVGLFFMGKQGLLPNSNPTPERSKEATAPTLSELIKLRVAVDAIDAATTDPLAP